MASILKVDEIKERSVGSGITLGHALKNSSGTEIMSAAGVFSSNINGGTISNATLDSTVTFPANHIIQVAHNSKGDENSVYTTSSSHEIVHDSSGNNEWVINVSGITSGNKIFLMFTFTVQAYSSSYDSAFGGYGICRDTISNLVISSTSGSDAGVNTQANASGVSAYDVITLTAYDTPTSASHNYYLTHRVINSNYQTRVSSDLPTQFFAFEVQQ